MACQGLPGCLDMTLAYRLRSSTLCAIDGNGSEVDRLKGVAGNSKTGQATGSASYTTAPDGSVVMRMCRSGAFAARVEPIGSCTYSSEDVSDESAHNHWAQERKALPRPNTQAY